MKFLRKLRRRFVKRWSAESPGRPRLVYIRGPFKGKKVGKKLVEVCQGLRLGAQIRSATQGEVCVEIAGEKRRSQRALSKITHYVSNKYKCVSIEVQDAEPAANDAQRSIPEALWLLRVTQRSLLLARNARYERLSEALKGLDPRSLLEGASERDLAWIEEVLTYSHWRNVKSYRLRSPLGLDTRSNRTEGLLEAIASHRRSRNYRAVELLAGIAERKLWPAPAPPLFCRRRSIEVLDRGLRGGVVMICFQGFMSTLTRRHFEAHGIERLEDMNESGLPYALKNFSEVYDGFNSILVKDNYQTWYQFNTERYVAALQEELARLKAAKIVCVGSSAGGFGAILFGQLLQADAVFAFAPRCTAFMTSMNEFRRELNKRYLMAVGKYVDLGVLQRESGGFYPKVNVYLCGRQAQDVAHIRNLDMTDPRLSIREYDCDSHNVIKAVGKEEVFADIFRSIDVRGAAVTRTF